MIIVIKIIFKSFDYFKVCNDGSKVSNKYFGHIVRNHLMIYFQKKYIQMIAKSWNKDGFDYDFTLKIT